MNINCLNPDLTDFFSFSNFFPIGYELSNEVTGSKSVNYFKSSLETHWKNKEFKLEFKFYKIVLSLQGYIFNCCH